MTDFMSDFKEAAELRERFVSYVIESCCLEDPGMPHMLLLVLGSLLQKYGHGKNKVIIFTTNYDNLLERVYYSPARTLRRAWISTRMGFSLRAGNLPVAKPTYSLTVSQDSRELTVVPLHGSIRVCRCPGCARILATEAAALERKRCVYCGREIPRVVVPTTEGEADKEVLSLLAESVSTADLMLFVGYGFADPHIMERLKEGVSRNPRRALLRPINICHTPFPATDMGFEASAKVTNLDNDIEVVLSQLTSHLGSKVPGPLGEFATALQPSSPLLTVGRSDFIYPGRTIRTSDLAARRTKHVARQKQGRKK